MKDLIDRLRNDTLDDISDTALEAADALERLTAGDVALPKTQWLGDIHGFIIAQLKEYGDRKDAAGYMRGFHDGMKEAPTGDCWIRVIDEEMVGAHLGIADMGDDYGTAKEKLNALICWHVGVSAAAAVLAEPVIQTIASRNAEVVRSFDQHAMKDRR